MGLSTTAENITDEKAWQLIVEPDSARRAYYPGGGRGVGMDVAGHRVKSWAAATVIESTRGQGSAFTIRLPSRWQSARHWFVRVSRRKCCALPWRPYEGVREPMRARRHRRADSLGKDDTPVRIWGQTIRSKAVSLSFASLGAPRDGPAGVRVSRCHVCAHVGAGEASTALGRTRSVGQPRDRRQVPGAEDLRNPQVHSGARSCGAPGRIVIILSHGSLVRSESGAVGQASETAVDTIQREPAAHSHCVVDDSDHGRAGHAAVDGAKSEERGG